MQVVYPDHEAPLRILAWEAHNKEKFAHCIKCKVYYADADYKLCSYCKLGLH
jgi:hypothetical protein